MGKKSKKKVKWRPLSLGEEEEEQSLEAESPHQRQDGEQRNYSDGSGAWVTRDCINGTYYGPADSAPPAYRYEGRRTTWGRGRGRSSPNRRFSNRFNKPPQYFNNVVLNPFEQPQTLFNAPVMPMIYFPTTIPGGIHRPFCPAVMPQAARCRPLQPLDWFNARIPANCQYYYALSQPPRNTGRTFDCQAHAPEAEAAAQASMVDPTIPPPDITTIDPPGMSAENSVLTSSPVPATASVAALSPGVSYMYPGYSFGPAVFKTPDFFTSGRRRRSGPSPVRSPKKRKRKRKRKTKAANPVGGATGSVEEDLSDADTPDTFSRSSDSFDFGLTNGETAQVLQCSAAYKSEIVVMEGNEQSPKMKKMDLQSTDSGKDYKKPRRDIGASMVNGDGGDAVPEVNGNCDEDDAVPALPASQEVKSLVDNILSSALEEATLGIRDEIQKLSPSTSVVVNPHPEPSEIPEDLLCNFNPEDGEILEILQPCIAGTDSKLDQVEEVELRKPDPPAQPMETLARDFPKLPLVDNLFTVNLVDDIISSAIDEAVHNPPPFECEDVSDLVFLGQSTLEDSREGSQERTDLKQGSPAVSETMPREPVERTLITEILFVSETSFMDDLPEEKEIQENKTDETSEQVPGSPSVQLNPDAPVFVPSFLKENETESEDGSPQKPKPETTTEEEESPISDSPETVISPSANHDEETSVTSTEEIIGSPESKRTLNLDIEKDILTAEVAAELSALNEILDSEMKNSTDIPSEELLSNEQSNQKPVCQISSTHDLLTEVKQLLHEDDVTTSEPATPQPLSKSDETTLSPEIVQSTVSNDESVISSVALPELEVSKSLIESLPENDSLSVVDSEKNKKKPADIMQTLEDAIQKSLDDLPHSDETKKFCSVDKEEAIDFYNLETIQKPLDIQQADDSQIDSAVGNSLNSNKDLDLLGSFLMNNNENTESLINISENPIFQTQSVPSNPEHPDISSLVDVSSVPATEEVQLLDLEEVDLSSNLKSSFQEQKNCDSEQQASESLDITQDVLTKEMPVSAESFQVPEESGHETTSISSEIWQKDDAREVDGSSLSNFLPVDGKISPALISLENDTDAPPLTLKSDVTDHPLSQKPEDIMDDAELEGDFDYVGEKYMTESQEFYDPTKFKNYYQICSSVDVPDSPRDQAIAALQSQTPPVSPQAQSPLVAKIKTSEKGKKVNVPMDNLQPRTSEIVVHEADDLSECGSEDIETIGHRYEASEAHRHLYVNRLSLAAELLGTRQDLPYDDEFKPLVDNEGTVIAAPPPTPASPFTSAEAHSNRHIYDSYYGSRDAPTSTPTPGSVAVGPLRSSGGREVSDSGVQSEESGDDADDVTKPKTKKDKNNKSDDEQDVFDKSRVTGFSYKQFGGGRRPISSVLKGKTDPLCLCCSIM